MDATPAMVDRALEQTRAAGLTYAAVPLPWWEQWAGWQEVRKTRFDWDGLCLNPDIEREGGGWPIDDEGNVLVCLLPVGHDAECGHSGLVPATVGGVPAIGLEGSGATPA